MPAPPPFDYDGYGFPPGVNAWAKKHIVRDNIINRRYSWSTLTFAILNITFAFWG